MYCLGVLVPNLFPILLSFFKWNGLSWDFTFLGFQNYVKMFGDPIVKKAFLNNIYFAFFTMVLTISISLVTMEKNNYLKKGRTRMLSDTLNWALYGDIKDMDLILNSGFNYYYSDLYGSGEETFPRHMAHRSIEYQRGNIEINRPHVEAIRKSGIKYIYYSSSCTFDATFFDDVTRKAFECVFKNDEIAFGTPDRLYACRNSEEWLQFQIEKTVIKKTYLPTCHSVLCSISPFSSF